MAFLYSKTLVDFLLVVITILFSFSFNYLTDATEANPPPRFRKIYAFGDSFTDTGNTKNADGPSGFGHVSNPPYGSTYFHHPTNRYSDGRLVIDFVMQELGLPLLPPYLHIKGNDTHGVNFAVAGSTAINHQFFVRNNLSLDITPESIETQLLWFNRYLDKRGCEGEIEATNCKSDIENALFWFGEIGVNDYAYIIGSSISGDTIRKLTVESVTKSLQALLEKGAKFLVVQGLPLTGCLPLAMYLAPENDRDDLGCVKSVNNQSYVHNLALQAKVKELRSQYPQAVITYADYWNAYRTVFLNATQYGFKERFQVCCGSGDPPLNFDVFSVCGMASAKACSNPSQYINWDGVHLTEAMYKVVSDMYLHGNFIQPPFSHLLNEKQKRG